MLALKGMVDRHTNVRRTSHLDDTQGAGLELLPKHSVLPKDYGPDGDVLTGKVVGAES